MADKLPCKYNCGNSYPNEAKKATHEKRCKLRPIKKRGKYNIQNPRKAFSFGPRPKKVWSCRFCNDAKFDKEKTRDKHEVKYHNRYSK